jgi:hypothetical protein
VALRRPHAQRPGSLTGASGGGQEHAIHPESMAPQETQPGISYDLSKVSTYVSALAYTVGDDVAFAEGMYAPHTIAGRWLLAHELAHVRQEGGPVLHEMYHLEQEKTGKSNDPKMMARAPFVKAMLDEEIQAAVHGYQAYLELEQKELTPPNSEPPRFDMYKSAYYTGRKRTLKANPSAPEVDLHREGLKDAEALIRWYIQEGGLGPHLGLTYEQYYTAQWRKAQRTK